MSLLGYGENIADTMKLHGNVCLNINRTMWHRSSWAYGEFKGILLLKSRLRQQSAHTKKQSVRKYEDWQPVDILAVLDRALDKEGAVSSTESTAFHLQ